jgi:hypothetical protein
MALQAVWPLIAQAKPRSVTLVPVCTVGGVTHYFEVKAGDTPLEKRSTSQHEHCAFCSFHDARAAALPNAPCPLLLAGDAAAAPSDFLPLQELPQRHPSARPRAPPPAA